jgi:ABC-type sugar transport system ATPase subunit
MADIKLIDIEKYFGKNYVIRKLNLEIKDRFWRNFDRQ